MFLSGLSELLVINTFQPFLAVITDPKVLSNYGFSKIISKVLNIPLDGSVIFPFIFLFAISVIISTAFRLSSLWLSQKVTALIGSDISVQSFSNNIYQPYKFHIKNNTSKQISINTQFVDNTISALGSLINLTYSLILTLIISFAIFLISPSLTIFVIILFTILYLSVGKRFKLTINKNSEKRVEFTQSLIKLLQEGIGSIRNILLESNQKIYIRNFKNYDLKNRNINVKARLISEFPKHVIEALAFLFLAFASLFFIRGTNNSSIIIVLGAFTIGLQKLLPSFQKMYNSWTIISSFKSDIDLTYKTLEMKPPKYVSKNIVPLVLKKTIKFDSVFFHYKEKELVISNLNLEIFKGQKIGIIGKTGSGKSTFSDLLMGLLIPTKGKIYIDNKDMHDPNFPNLIRQWMKSIAHVPQNIFLSDTSFIENIAFGVDKNLISLKKVEYCAKKAQIHEFIKSTSDGYLTKVGERGIRLSGGQRQRIAIARALYHDPQILIFDEATSALDNDTEKYLLKSINKLSKELTIISIAHRLTTLKDYDRIFKIDKGNIKEVKLKY
jgi:ATP-binding cassette subfamily B protein